MLQIDKVQRIEGVTVFGDNKAFDTFYLVPERPSMRRTASGKLTLSFYKYRFAVDRPDGKKGGGFVLFDVAFVVDPVTEKKVIDVLQAQVRETANRLDISPVPTVRIGTITYTKGTVNLIIAGSDGTFVQSVQNSGNTSVYGENTSTFGVELTPEGATFFEQAMQGEGASLAVEQDLTFIAALPKVKIRAGFRATEFYKFYQSIDTDWNLWSEDSYRETIREQMVSSESLWFEPDWGMLTDEKVKSEIRDWAMRTVEDATERKMIAAIAPVPDDERKKPDGIEDVTRDIQKTKISSFSLNYSEANAIEWNIRPNGPLPNIASMTDPSGAPYKWADYARVIDLDDPFFRTIRVNVLANADFKELPIHSVEVMLRYQGRPMANLVEGDPEGEVVLTSPDKLGKFASFVQNNDWKYEYSYQINYRGQSRTFQSETIKTDEGNLTIGVDDVGILAVDIAAGDLNWNDVEQALVTFSYEDRDVPRIEHQFQLNKATTSHRVQEVIFQPMRKNYEYQVKYFLKDGREVMGEKSSGRAGNLFINDVFSARRDVGVRGVGDFQQRIRTIFLDLAYDDPGNDYHLTKSIALDANTTFLDWSFPVVSQTAGEVSYSGNVAFKDGTSEKIPRTVAETNTILVPAPVEDLLEVEIVPDLIDWTQTRLARLSLAYDDAANNVSDRKDFIFSKEKSAIVKWKVEVRDRSRKEYTYTVTYFMADNSRKTRGPETVSGESLVLDPFQ